jgi:membrane fusion protein (multidrug efflux system)
METDNPHGREVNAKPAAMIKPLVILFVAVIVILGAIYGWQAFRGKMIKKYMDASAVAPQTVSTVEATMETWQARLQAVGSLRAARGADLSAQIAGVVDKINFESGSEVAAGAVLLKLKANDDPAKLAQLEAIADLAQQTYKRDQEQFAAQAISQAVLDNDQSSLKSARAQVAAQQALIEEKVVRAPFAGKLGIRQIDEGQYLTAGAAVVTLQALDPILIDFYVPQQAFARLKIGQTATATIDTYPGSSFVGAIDSINSKVDAASRNVQVRASFHNADRRLLPGMYATVVIDAGTATTQITLPQAAISYNPYGDTVYVIEKSAPDANGKSTASVQQRFIKLGATRGDQVAVLSGLKVGDSVVSGGQMKLRNGTPVTINNAVQPANDISPTPPNE